MLKRIELASGLLAGILGLVALAFIAFGPLYSTRSASGADRGTSAAGGSAGLLQAGLPPRTAIFLALVLLCAIGATVGAYLHSRHGDTIGLFLLCLSAALLAGGVGLSIFSAGALLASAVLLAVTAAVAAIGGIGGSG